jgi:hypothetical protein
MQGWKLVNNGATDPVPYPIAPGCTRLTFRGEEIRFECISDAPNEGSEGKVKISRPCPDCKAGACQSYWHRNGRIESWVYPSVIHAEIVPDVPRESGDDTRTRYVVRQGRIGYKIVQADGNPTEDKYIRTGLDSILEAQLWADLLNEAYELGRKEGIKDGNA